MQNQIEIPPNIVSVHPTDSEVGKLLDFDNIWIGMYDIVGFNVPLNTL